MKFFMTWLGYMIVMYALTLANKDVSFSLLLMSAAGCMWIDLSSWWFARRKDK